MEVGEAPRNLRLVTGPVDEVEAWVNAHWEDYGVQNFVWSVIDGKQHVTIVAFHKTALEKAMRMMQLANVAGPGGNRRPM